MGALLLAMQAPLQAQTTSASVSGQVKDSQGGVAARRDRGADEPHPGQHADRPRRTAEGRFVFPIVRPDAYTLKVTLQGFKTLERANVVVSANDKFSAGVLALQVGDMTEEISVLSRVSELQTTSGERSFTLESEALKNIANNGRALFNFATLVPGVLSQNTGNAPTETVSAFTVNGQRPNSNNMTIDGVANIDTGDNGGNMATTNIDAVAEFKILTNAYQAEYGRAVGGQVQVVTKSGTQSFHGSGYWYGRRSDWNANSWTNKRAAAPAPVGNGKVIEPPTSKRNDYGFTIGGPIFIPGVQHGEEEALLLLQPGVPEAHQPAVAAPGPRAHRPRAGRRLLAERRQQRQPVPLHPRLHDRAALQSPRTRAAASRTAACSARSPRAACTRRASPP